MVSRDGWLVILPASHAGNRDLSKYRGRWSAKPVGSNLVADLLNKAALIWVTIILMYLSKLMTEFCHGFGGANKLTLCDKLLF